MYLDGGTSEGKYKKLCRSKEFMDGYSRAVRLMHQVGSAGELAKFSFLHYEKLRGLGTSSVRPVNGRVERLLFRELPDGVEVELIEIDMTHYGNKK